MNIRARAPGTIPKCCSPNLIFIKPSSNRAGALIRSGSRWWRKSSKRAESNSGVDRRKKSDALVKIVLSVFDRYPVPDSLGAPTWRKLRIDLERRLQLIGLHPPKRAIDIPEPFAKPYFDLMPIHEKLRGRDYPTTQNYLKVTLCNIHEELTKRIDTNAVAALFGARATHEQVGGG